MAARKPRKPKAQKSEYPTLQGQLGYLNSYYCPVCGKHLFSAERFWIWTNGSEKKNQRQQVKN